MGLKAALQKLLRDRAHQEVNSGESMAVETGLSLSQNDLIRQMIRQELFRQQADDAAETFEEADDFDLPPEEGEWVSGYEDDFDPPSETNAPVNEVLKTPPPAPDPGPKTPDGDVS